MEAVHDPALRDPLTGLPNRSLLFDRLRRALVRARRRGTQVGLLVIDIDHFREVNDALGHVAGDEVLRVLATRFSAVLRSSDTVGRLDGDEFAVICEGLAAVEDAERVAARVAATLDPPIALDRQERRIEASIGMSVGDGLADPDDLVRAAEHAMGRVKVRHAVARR